MWALLSIALQNSPPPHPSPQTQVPEPCSVPDVTQPWHLGPQGPH